MELPLFDRFNYKLQRESDEVSGEFEERVDGKIILGWEMRVQGRGADGVPYLMIFPGPTAKHRGSAIRLHLVTKDGGEVPDDAEVLFETYHMSGEERQVISQGKYGQFKEIPDQYADNAALAAQKRAEAGEHYIIRVGITVPGNGPRPALMADDSFFEIECLKHWFYVSA